MTAQPNICAGFVPTISAHAIEAVIKDRRPIQRTQGYEKNLDANPTRGYGANMMSARHNAEGKKMTTTDEAMVGEKAVFDFGGREIIARIERRDSTFPKTAYTIIWTQDDNPSESTGGYSVAHCSQLLSVI